MRIFLTIWTMFAFVVSGVSTDLSFAGFGNRTTTSVTAPHGADLSQSMTNLEPGVVAARLHGAAATGNLVSWDTKAIRIKQDNEIIDIPADQLLSLRFDNRRPFARPLLPADHPIAMPTTRHPSMSAIDQAAR